jgi:hypothetical protein
MTAEVLSCPYCNARVALSAEDAGRPRVRCPRCGDTFPHRAVPAAERNGSPAAHPDSLGEGSLPARAPAWSNAAVARLILGVMGTMAVIGLAFALWTQPFRRANDRKKTPGGEPEAIVAEPVSATKPSRLAGLGYLPAATEIVAGLHVGELLQDADGARILRQFQGSRAGSELQHLADKMGLDEGGIDHLVLGVYPTGGQPRAALVIKLRQTYPAEKLKALPRAQPDTYQGKPVYRFRSDLVQGLVYQAAADVLIVNLGLGEARTEDLRALPGQPRRGDEGLSALVRECLGERLQRGSLLWVVGSLSGQPLLRELLLARADVPDTTRRVLSEVEAFAVGIRQNRGITLSAAVRGKDEQAARQLAAALRKPPDAKVQVTAADPGPNEPWVLVQVSGSAELSDLLAGLRLGSPGQGR